MTSEGHVGQQLEPYTMYHGTSEGSAKRIARRGFQPGVEGHGQSAGSGVYLSDRKHVAAQYGSHVLTVQMPGHFEIHPNPYRDSALGKWPSERISEALHVEHAGAYHGHEDPDEKGTVVVHPWHRDNLKVTGMEKSK